MQYALIKFCGRINYFKCVYTQCAVIFREISKEKFVKDINKNKTNLAISLKKLNDLPKIIKKSAQSGDLVIFIGAGDITKWANNLPKQLKNL